MMAAPLSDLMHPSDDHLHNSRQSCPQLREGHLRAPERQQRLYDVFDVFDWPSNEPFDDFPYQRLKTRGGVQETSGRMNESSKGSVASDAVDCYQRDEISLLRKAGGETN
jgi:hypothetical protein